MADVTQIQQDSKNSAQSYLNQAEAFLNSIAGYVSQTFPTINVDIPLGIFLTDAYAQTLLTDLKSRRPTSVTLTQAAFPTPATPSLVDASAVPILSIPDLVLNAPTLSLGNAPSALTQTFNKVAPEFKSPDIPARPTFTLPATPTFNPLSVPEVPALDLPIFTASEPIDTVSAPTYTFNWSESDYSSQLLDALKAELLYDIQNGGYGIEVVDERRLWERVRERELANATAKMAELTRIVEGRGLSLPSGAYFAMLGDAQQELIDKNAQASREIAIKKADLYVQNRQFTIQQSQQYEQMYIQYWGFRAERALNAAKAVVQLSIDVFNAQVAKQNLKLEGYKVAASVYETKIRASLAKLEIFKTQVEAARVDAERQRIYVEVYMTQIKAIETLMNAYRVDMEGARIKASIEEAKLNAFKTEIEAYLAQVQAKDSEFKMYTAQIAGEEAKVRLYEAQVRAHATRVAALKARSDIDVQTANLKLENNRLLIEKYRSELQKYLTDIQAYNETNRSTIAKYQADISAYNAESDITGKAMDFNRAIQTTNVELYNRRFDQSLQNARFRFEEAIRTSEFRFKAAEVGANVHTNIGVGFANQLAAIATKAE